MAGIPDLSGLSGLSGLVLSRVRAHRLPIAAALLTVLLTTTVLATLAAFADATGDAGLRRTLGRQEAARTVVDIRSRVTAEDQEATDRRVRKAARQVYGGLPTAVTAVTRSGPYALPAGTGRPRTPGATADGGGAARMPTLTPPRTGKATGRSPPRSPTSRCSPTWTRPGFG